MGDPYAAETQFSSMVETIAASRREANRIKREQPITVVIGNPPYKEKAKGRGGWIEGRQDVAALRARRSGAATPAPMDLWSPPARCHIAKIVCRIQLLQRDLVMLELLLPLERLDFPDILRMCP